ncbi:MAG: hypothetical protein BGO26_08175 [Actinobacteria bacterium 69-20]|jgi:hypothetical protein|nr:DUF4097 family beta strand repeat protein [Actinomycetota bacterium]OJV30298.1 MAG: hypothetical protein BGO26_08175 [Actinobacteria bacterium 69-20]
MHTFETPGPLTIEIHNHAGEIRLELTDTTTTTVEFSVAGDPPVPWLQELWGTFGGPGRAPFDAPSIDRAIADFSPAADGGGSGGRLFIDTRPAVAGWRRRIDVRVTAPRLSEARLHGQATDVRIAGPVGPLTVHTASGDVTADECSADARLTMASGDVVLGSVAGNASLRSVSGDVRIGTVAGRAEVQSTSGDVRIGSVGGDATVRTVSGDVTIAEARSGAVRIATVSGGVDIGLRNGALASVGLSSMSGRVHSDLAVETNRPAAPASNEPGAAQRRTDVDIRVKTVSGDIRIRRANHSGGAPAAPPAP